MERAVGVTTAQMVVGLSAAVGLTLVGGTIATYIRYQQGGLAGSGTLFCGSVGVSGQAGATVFANIRTNGYVVATDEPLFFDGPVALAFVAAGATVTVSVLRTLDYPGA